VVKGEVIRTSPQLIFVNLLHVFVELQEMRFIHSLFEIEEVLVTPMSDVVLTCQRNLVQAVHDLEGKDLMQGIITNIAWE
jgi:hypothetical protein